MLASNSEIEKGESKIETTTMLLVEHYCGKAGERERKKPEDISLPSLALPRLFFKQQETSSRVHVREELD